MAEYDSHSLPNLQENLSKITLDNITSVSLNTDALRENFEAIVTILKGLVKRADHGQNDAQQANKDIKDLKDKLEKLEDRQNKDRNDLNEKISNTDAQVKTIQDHTDKNTHDIEKLQDSLRELRDNQDNLGKSLENSQNDLSAIKEKLDDHDKQIQDLYNKASSSNNNGSEEYNEGAANSKNEIDSLRQDMNDMKKNFDDQINALHKLLDEYVKKEEFNPFRDQTENKLTSHQDSIDDLYNMLKDLKSKISDKLDCETFDEHINDYNNIKNIVINLANNNGDQKNVVQQVISSGAALSTKDANLLKELGQKFPELEALVKKIQKDLVEHSLTFKTFADEAHRKIVNNDENLKSHKTESNKRIGDLEAAIKSLRDQILNINISGPSTSSGSSSAQGSGDNSAELRRIHVTLNAVVERVDNLEKELSDLQKLKEKVNQIQNTTNENKQKIGTIEEELNELRALKLKIELLEQMMRDRENTSRDSRPKPGRGATSDNLSPGSGVTLDQVRHIVDEEIRKLRDEILAMLDAMRAALDKKAEADDLWKTEASLLERLDQIAGALMKRAQGDKNDTKKALMFLEKKIKEITVVLFGGQSHGEDGAILSKKPWNPWSCASCDSKLKDEPRALIDYKNWNKMPPRETSPGRLTQGKFGKGWTKWSETRKTTHEKVRDPFSANSNKGGDTLPEIHRESGRKEMDSSRVNE